MAASAAALVAIVLTQGGTGDYSLPTCDPARCDPQPTIQGLARGDFDRALAFQPAMGPLSLYLRVPAYWVTDALDAGLRWEYRLGALLCLLPVLAVALMVRRRATHLAPPLVVFVVVATAVNPAIFGSLDIGHPEELLTASLVVASAMLVAGRGWVAGALLIGLAIATKHWALLALPPIILLVTPQHRLRFVGLAVAVAAALFAPFAVADPSGFLDALAQVASPDSPARPASIWWAFADPAIVLGQAARELDPATEGIARVLAGVVLAAVAIGGSFRLRHQGLHAVLLLVALLLLLRCLLDPFTLSYYHAPFLMAGIAADAVGRRTYPVTGLVACALYVLNSQLAVGAGLGHPAQNVVYLVTMVPFAVWLGLHLWRRVPRAAAAVP